jgi:probable F420-dependent oxidoreductase
MDFGIGYFPTADAVGPGELPRKYTATLDLFVALTAAALATSRLRVGSGISLVIQRDPIVTAKEVASIDVLSGGRMDFGVGAGWNREEMEHHGTDPRTRMRLLAERVEAMKALWTERETTFHGEFVNFDRVLMEPKPLQRPHPPVWVGGHGPTVIDRVLAFGDAWFPNWTPNITDRAAELRSRAERPVDFMAMGPPADPKVLEQLAEADTRLVSWWLPSGGYSVLEPELEKVERAIAEFHGEA